MRPSKPYSRIAPSRQRPDNRSPIPRVPPTLFHPTGGAYYITGEHLYRSTGVWSHYCCWNRNNCRLVCPPLSPPSEACRSLSAPRLLTSYAQPSNHSSPRSTSAAQRLCRPLRIGGCVLCFPAMHAHVFANPTPAAVPFVAIAYGFGFGFGFGFGLALLDDRGALRSSGARLRGWPPPRVSPSQRAYPSTSASLTTAPSSRRHQST